MISCTFDGIMATQGDVRVSLAPFEKGLVLPSSVPILRGKNHFCRQRSHEEWKLDVEAEEKESQLLVVRSKLIHLIC